MHMEFIGWSWLFWEKQAAMWVQRIGLGPGFSPIEAVGIQILLQGTGSQWLESPPGVQGRKLGHGSGGNVREETQPKSILRDI